MDAQGNHHRRSSRLPLFDYSNARTYFVTLCTRDRACLLTDPAIHRIIAEVWQALPQWFPTITLDEFVVMPNHIHFILWLGSDHNPPTPGVGATLAVAPDMVDPRHVEGAGASRTNLNVVQAFGRPAPTDLRPWKIPECKKPNDHPTLGDVVGGFKSLVFATYLDWIQANRLSRQAKFWQRNYYEHIVRNDRELEHIRFYIQQNPVNWEKDRDNIENPAKILLPSRIEDYLDEIGIINNKKGTSMENLPPIDTDYLLQFLTDLLNTPSPTGYAQRAIDFTAQALGQFPDLVLSRTRKGALIAAWAGQKSDSPRALTAHVDTLGVMVKEIKPNGRLKMSRIGGYAWNTIEGEGCTVFTAQGRAVRGSILLTEASSHIHGPKVNEEKRDDENMEVRLDALTLSAEDTRGLGIQVGDFIAFDPRVEINEGFIRSRHLDDKASVACILAAVKALHEAGLQPLQTTFLHISNYEEVGHGASAGIPPEVTELVTVDMAAVGEGQASDEFHPSLCVKDSGGPYHHELSQRLRQLADEHQISYKVDIYPFYGSDGEAFWRAGGDVAVALIGPGVDASHNYERTHTQALVGTAEWLAAYLTR